MLVADQTFRNRNRTPCRPFPAQLPEPIPLWAGPMKLPSMVMLMGARAQHCCRRVRYPRTHQQGRGPNNPPSQMTVMTAVKMMIQATERRVEAAVQSPAQWTCGTIRQLML